MSIDSVVPPAATVAQEAVGLEPVTVLVVDDDDGVRAVVVDALEEAGLTVIEADSAFVALDLIVAGLKFDLALLDFSMPGMTGRELGAVLAEIGRDAQVLYLTGYSGVTELKDIRADRILSKPFDLDALTQRVRGEIAARSLVN